MESLFQDAEIEALLSILAHFAPSYGATEPFVAALQRARELLAAQQSSLSTSEMYEWVATWRSNA